MVSEPLGDLNRHLFSLVRPVSWFEAFVLGLWLYGFVGLEGAPPELTQARGLGRWSGVGTLAVWGPYGYQ